MLRFRIRELLQSKGINKAHAWLKKIGIPHHSAYKLLNKNTNRIKQQHIEQICLHAWCTPNDLFVYDSAKLPLEPNHPLNNLQARESFDLYARLQKMSPEELKGLMGFLDGD